MRGLVCCLTAGLLWGGLATGLLESDAFAQFGGGGDPFGGDPDPFGGGNDAGEQNAPLGDDGDPFDDPFPSATEKPKERTLSISFEKQPEDWPRGAGLGELLNQKVTIRCEKTPLEEIAEELTTATGKNFVIDQSAFNKVGLGADSPVSIRVRSTIPLRAALPLLLSNIDPDLDYFVRDDILTITTRETTEELLAPHVLDVHDLLPANNFPKVRHVLQGGTRTVEDWSAEELADLIKATIFVHYWDEVGGPWSMESVDGMLVASMRDGEPLIAIKELLAELRRAGTWDGRNPTLLKEIASKHAAVFEALDAKVTLQFHDQPLNEALDFIYQNHDVEVLIHRIAFQNIGFGNDTPVRVDLTDVKLKTGLKKMLRSIDPDLRVVPIASKTFMVTTDEVENERLATTVYPIRDLANVDYEAEVLLELIRTTVDSRSWAAVGGSGSISYFAPAKALVVSQTHENLLTIDKLLMEIRERWAVRLAAQQKLEQRQAKPEPAPPPVVRDRRAEADWPVAVYHLEIRGPRTVHVNPKTNEPQFVDGVVQSLEVIPPLLRRITGEENWSHAKVELVQIGGQLYVRQTPAMHNRIEDLLRKLGVLAWKPAVLAKPFRGNF